MSPDFKKLESGAAERSKLEPFSTSELLEELESWSQIISSEPEIQKALGESSECPQPGMEP